MSLIYFAFVTGQYGLTFWLPTIVKASGVQGNLNIGLISAIPFLCAAVVMVLLGLSADRMRERRWHLIVPALIGAVDPVSTLSIFGELRVDARLHALVFGESMLNDVVAVALGAVAGLIPVLIGETRLAARQFRREDT